MPEWSRAVIIANPNAGGSPVSLVQELKDSFGDLTTVETHWTSASGDATVLALRAGTSAHARGEPTMVIAVGGDGTVSEVAAGLATLGRQRTEQTTAMLALPAGTANSIYRTWWEDLPWQQALACCLGTSGAVRFLDMARWCQTGYLVLAGASAGFPPQSIYEASLITSQSGWARYETAMLELIHRFKPYQGSVIVDGEEVHRGSTLLANVGGSRYRGGQFAVLPHTVLDDGLLDVVVVGAEHDLADVILLARTAEHVDLPGAVYARGRRISIVSTDSAPVWFERDGEVLARTGGAFTFETVAQCVPVLVGAAAAGKLTAP